MDKLTLTQLKIFNFRALKNIELNFNSGLNEISGANGTGKSTILDAIRFMVSDRDENNKRFDNYETIVDENQTINPSIILVLEFKNKVIELKVNNKKWYFNNIEQKSRTNYLETLYQWLNVKPENFVIAINPQILSNMFFGSKKEDRDNIRTNVVAIANALDSSHKIISQIEFDNLINQIRVAKEKVKDSERQIKEVKAEIEVIEKNNPDIKNWNLSNETKNVDQKIFEYQQNRSRYDAINSKISDLYDVKQKLEWKIQDSRHIIDSLKYSQSRNENNSNSKMTTIGLTILILLSFTIIFGLIYYFAYLRPKYKNDDNKNISSDLRAENDNLLRLEKQLMDVDSQIQDLQNDEFYKNFKIQVNDGVISELNNQKTQGEEINRAKLIHKGLVDKLDNYLYTQKNLKDGLANFEAKKRMITQQTNNVVKKLFPNFDINLFGDDEKEALVVSENNIPIKYLNHSNKMNIIFEINNFISKQLNFEVFNLIDGGESFNKINTQSQTVVAKVTNEKGLWFNGKNLY